MHLGTDFDASGSALLRAFVMMCAMFSGYLVKKIHFSTNSHASSFVMFHRSIVGKNKMDKVNHFKAVEPLSGDSLLLTPQESVLVNYKVRAIYR